jgi:hypothetical protein|nr:MAG TPA: hypothetical protein [Caudoviricetes sp.]
MPIPKTLEICKSSLWDDINTMNEKGVPAILQERILRIRDMYNMWLQFPSKKDQEIVTELIQRYGVHKSAAYEDIRIIKTLLGDLNKASKDYHRWKFNNMILKAYEIAERRKDSKSMVAASDKYAKYNQLDKEDILDNPWEIIAVQPFEPTSDPTVIGINPVPNIKEKIAKKIKQYWNEDVEDVRWEEADYREDELFNLKADSDAGTKE